jgi:hypothetical protein
MSTAVLSGRGVSTVMVKPARVAAVLKANRSCRYQPQWVVWLSSDDLGVERIVDIVPSDHHSMFLSPSGRVHTCRYNIDGRLGHPNRHTALANDESPRRCVNVPTLLPFLHNDDYSRTVSFRYHLFASGFSLVHCSVSIGHITCIHLVSASSNVVKTHEPHAKVSLRSGCADALMHRRFKFADLNQLHVAASQPGTPDVTRRSKITGRATRSGRGERGAPQSTAGTHQCPAQSTAHAS